VNLYFI